MPACCPICASNRIARTHTRWHDAHVAGSRVDCRTGAGPVTGVDGNWPHRTATRSAHQTMTAIALVILLGVVLSAVFWSLLYSDEAVGRCPRGTAIERSRPVESFDTCLSKRVGGPLVRRWTGPEPHKTSADECPSGRDVVQRHWRCDRHSCFVTRHRTVAPGEISMYRTSLHMLKGMSRFDVRFKSDLGRPLVARGERQGCHRRVGRRQNERTRASYHVRRSVLVQARLPAMIGRPLFGLLRYFKDRSTTRAELLEHFQFSDRLPVERCPMAQSASSASPKASTRRHPPGNCRCTSSSEAQCARQRLDRDVLSHVGTTHIVLFMGTNDIRRNASASQVIGGCKTSSGA